MCGQASAITLDSFDQGWLTPTSPRNTGNLNYLAGSYNNSEYRNFFLFSLPAFSSPILSADLVLNTFTTALTQAPSLTYQVTSVPSAFGFSDLGTGTVYASRNYTGADQNQTIHISLDAAALSAIQAAGGGTFGLAGRVTSATFGSGQAQQTIFGYSDGAQSLEITTADAPEPASVALVCSGLLGFVLLKRRGVRG